VPYTAIGAPVKKRPHDAEQSDERAAVAAPLDFSLFRYLKRVINLDSTVPNGAFKLCYAPAGVEHPEGSSFACRSA
jgi:hypothetical protein